MFIINQDRDEMFAFVQEKIYIKTILNENLLFGFSLIYGDKWNQTNDDPVLGTFDTYDECEDELEKMYTYDKPYFVMDGYDDY